MINRSDSRSGQFFIQFQQGYICRKKYSRSRFDLPFDFITVNIYKSGHKIISARIQGIKPFPYLFIRNFGYLSILDENGTVFYDFIGGNYIRIKNGELSF